MGYAFEHNLGIPEGEMLAIAIMNAQIRDNRLTPQEELAKMRVKKPQYVCCVLTSDRGLLDVYVDEQTAINAIVSKYRESELDFSDDFIKFLIESTFKFVMVLVKE